MAERRDGPVESEGRTATAELLVPVGVPLEAVTTADAILLEAASLFRRNGYSKTTTRDIGRAVGIRGPSVYHHFKTKEDILYGICGESLRQLSERVTAAASSVADPLDRLKAMIKAHVRNLLEDPDMHTTTFVEMRWLSDARRAEVGLQRDAYESVFSDVIREAQTGGSLRADTTVRELTLALLGLLNWTAFWYRADGPLAADEIADLLLRLFLEGGLAHG